MRKTQSNLKLSSPLGLQRMDGVIKYLGSTALTVTCNSDARDAKSIPYLKI